MTNPSSLSVARKRIVFKVIGSDTINTIFQRATISTKLSRDLYDIWAAGGKQGGGIIESPNDSSIRLLGPGAFITNLTLAPDGIHHMAIKFVRNNPSDTTLLPEYNFEIAQFDMAENEEEGGISFVLNTRPQPVAAQIKLIVEGFYNITTNRLNMNDTARAYLRRNFPPFSIVDSAIAIIDSTTFTGVFLFANAPSGTYYIQLKHRNSIETWSKSNGQVYTFGSVLTYDFTTSASQAFGNNMKLKGTKYTIYSGDVNQNGVIDLTDKALTANDVANFVTGYVRTDVTGNGFVDVSDAAIVHNNATNFVTVIRP